MADSFIELNSGSGGSKVDTRTMVGGDHREVIVIGDPTTAAGVATVDATAGLKVDLGADNDVTLGAALPAGNNNIGDVDILVGGSAADGNSGNKSAATLRVVIATDQPQLTNALKVDGSATTQPVSIASVPSHDVTNAGTFAVQVTGAALTSLQLIDDPVLVDDAAFTPATSKIMMVGAEFDDSLPDSVDEGDAGALRMSARRELYTQIRDAAGNERGANVNASNQLTVSVDNTVTVASHAVTNAGTFAVQATLAAGAATIAKAEDVASADADVGVPAMAVRKATPANTSGTDGDYEMLQMSAGRLWTSATIDAAIPAGTNAIGKLAANSGVDIGDVDVTSIIPGTGATNLGKAEDAAHSDADTGVMALAVRDDTLNIRSGTENDYEPLHTTADGALWATITPSTTGGWTTFMATSGDGSTALTNSAQSVKGSAGTLGGWYIYNPNTSATYVIIYNTASGSVTVGTTNPQMVLCIPASSAANCEFTNGITFSTAISVAATTTGGGNTAPSTALEANFFYK